MRIGTRPALLAMAAIAMMAVCPLSYAQSPVVRAEKNLLAAVNQARRDQGLSPLRWDESLAAAARRHAAVMADRGSAQHAFDGEPSLQVRVKQAGVHFTWLSENVAHGPTSQFVHAQFMHSPSHRANILASDMNSIGVGVVEQAGQLFAVEDFAQIH